MFVADSCYGFVPLHCYIRDSSWIFFRDYTKSSFWHPSRNFTRGFIRNSARSSFLDRFINTFRIPSATPSRISKPGNYLGILMSVKEILPGIPELLQICSNTSSGILPGIPSNFFLQQFLPEFFHEIPPGFLQYHFQALLWKLLLGFLQKLHNFLISKNFFRDSFRNYFQDCFKNSFRDSSENPFREFHPIICTRIPPGTFFKNSFRNSSKYFLREYSWNFLRELIRDFFLEPASGFFQDFSRSSF